MRIDEKDLVQILKIKKTYKLKGTTDEIVSNYLSRCENCEKICFYDELKPIPNFKGEVYKCCEECQEEILQETYSFNEEDGFLQYLEDRKEVEW